jgi:HEPN domain-containing protein
MNERAERLRREVWRWLHLAHEDLAAAEHLADAAHLPHRVACLMAQQAAEKAIKAVLVAEDMDPPKLHDLRRLLERSASLIRMSERRGRRVTENARILAFDIHQFGSE